jgi:hypothetical protein
VSLVIECKSSDEQKKNQSFKNDIYRLSQIRRDFTNAIKKQYKSQYKRARSFSFWLWDLMPTDNDLSRAEKSNIKIFDENELSYYEQLAKQIGPAAKYQLFSDLYPKTQIHGLNVAVPALKAKMGKYTYYNFSISPEYLLKISYVSHRVKGSSSDADTYQRMIRRARLNKIRKYISEDGMFPTNIVISINGKRKVSFEPFSQEVSPEGAQLGRLIIRPCYKTAFIIDGQHRLFAYSGHERANTSYLNVLAFENLPLEKQAKMFVDINHEQKSVKTNYLGPLGWSDRV